MRNTLLSLGLALALVLALAGCGSSSTGADTQAQAPDNSTAAQTQSSQTEAQNTESQDETGAANDADTGTENANASDNANEPVSANGTLIVYFSCTGTTKGVAEMISGATGGDLFEIVPVQTYTADDLNYNDKSSRTSIEQNDSSIRPEIAGSIENWDAYSTVYLGHPIWWGVAPHIPERCWKSGNGTEPMPSSKA